MSRTSFQVLPFTPIVPLHHQLEEVIRRVTAVSDHSYEMAVHRLLEDLEQLDERGQIDTASYNAVLATAVDVLFFFNYDLDALAREENVWYRASLIHQMGHGMLQALEKYRPDLAQKPFFQEALEALAIGVHANTNSAPLTCPQWQATLEMMG